MSSLHQYRRAAGDRYVPYKPANGLKLPLRVHRHRRRAYEDEEGVPPLPPMKEVVSHSKGANRDAAAVLRDLIEDDTPAPQPIPTHAPAPYFATGANAYGSPSSGRGGYRHHRLPARSNPHRRPSKTFPGPDAANTFPPSPAHAAFPRTKHTQETFHKSIRRFQQYDKHRRGLHILQHVGGGDQMDEWRAQNHHLLMGQDSADIAPEEAGCDLPMVRTAAAVPTVYLDPDLPPLSAEHPARVWNAMLHALAPELQPIVRWEYDNIMLGEEWGYVARMSIFLPPTHPAVADHPVAKALPKDRYSPEYAKVMNVLGGVRSWVGPARKLKVDAQNTAITLCIAENALGWVHAPLMVPVDCFPKSAAEGSDVDLGVELVDGTTASIEFEHDNDLGVYGCHLTVGREPHFQHYTEDTVHLSAEAAQEAVCRRAVELNVRGFLAWLQGAELVEVADRPTSTEDEGTIEIEEDELWATEAPPVSDDETTSVPMGTKPYDGPEDMDVSEDVIASEDMDASEGKNTHENKSVSENTNAPEEIINAVPSMDEVVEASAEDRAAHQGHHAAPVPEANLNGRDACLPSSDDAPTPATPGRAATLIKPEPEATELFVPRPKPEKTDWQSQLAYFCHLSGFPPPSYSQRIMRRPGQSTMFLGRVMIEDETYESVDEDDTIFAARHSVAHQVFTETFGQEPVAVMDMPPAFRP